MVRDCHAAVCTLSQHRTMHHSLTPLRVYVYVFAAGAYADALKVFDEQEEMRKSREQHEAKK